MMAFKNQRVFVLSLLCLASLQALSVASSFAPTSSILRPSKSGLIQRHSSLFLSGGSDEGVESGEEASSEELSSSIEGDGDMAPPSQSSVSPAVTSKLGPNATPPGFLRRSAPAFPWHRLPDWLTYARCIAIPIFVALFYLTDSNVATGTVFALASFTDWLDGYLARRWDISSAFGAFLDPVSDKLMVSTSLILLAGRYGIAVAIPTAIILAREIAVSALREWMAQRGLRNVVKVGMQGKVKTALTMVALTILLFVPSNGEGLLAQLYMPGLISLYMCAVVTITSGSVYFLAAAPILLEKES